MRTCNIGKITYFAVLLETILVSLEAAVELFVSKAYTVINNGLRSVLSFCVGKILKTYDG